MNKGLFVLFFFLAITGCQAPLIEEGTFGKVVDSKDQRIPKVLVWAELYDELGALTELHLTVTRNGIYKIDSDLYGDKLSLYFFTEEHGFQMESLVSSFDKDREFQILPESSYPTILYKTHLEILDRISFWIQKKPETFTRRKIQILSDFLENHLYNLASENRDHALHLDWLDLSAMYASWYSHSEQLQNFPLIRLKLQEFQNPPKKGQNSTHSKNSKR